VRPTELKKCYRSDSKIRDLTIAFQRALFNEKYDIDDFLEQNGIGLFDSFEKEGYVNYIYLSNAQIVSTLYTIVHENILNRINNVSPNDITILGYTTPLLREFDHYYRLLSREKTKTMFETPEIMYRNQLNFISERDNPWFGNIFKHLVKIHFPNNTNLNDWQISKLKSYIALLLATSEIYKKYPERLNEILRETCNKCKISKDAFEAWLEHYADSISAFRILVHNADYEFIRKNKKMNFWMNCGMVKVSTIHSFKGWESQAIFLIVENNTSKEEFNELLYTGITRARENLVVINFGNTAYHKILKPLFDKVNNT
jgi:superfamily I DNA/RNA helicase